MELGAPHRFVNIIFIKIRQQPFDLWTDRQTNTQRQNIASSASVINNSKKRVAKAA